MINELARVIDQIWQDKGIDKKILIEAIESALVSAAKKKFGINKEIEARFNEDSGEIELMEFKSVVEDVVDPDNQISLPQAKKLDSGAEIGDSIGVKLEADLLGRISAQTAKQVIFQKMREAEKELVFNEFKDQSGKNISGIVRRFEDKTIVVEMGKTEGYIPPREQIPREVYRVGEALRAYMLEIERSSRGPQIILSRAHPQFLVKLFVSEVPEIKEGIVEIKGVAREAGVRSKIAVSSKDPDVDPVGACVGFKGSRVQSVVQELRGEKIDIIAWSSDVARYVIHALSPATVSEVMVYENDTTLEVIVPDDQLSLAIGRKGQNVRLAVQLIGWKIDIKSESKVKEIKETAKKVFAEIKDLGDKTSELVYKSGIHSVKELAECDLEVLVKIPGIDRKTAETVKQQAIELYSIKGDQMSAADSDTEGAAEEEQKE
ncbi:MAG TPA: transcription termination factor NusA [bacterium]